MKLKVIDTKNVTMGDVALPAQFEEVYRPDLIKRAVLAIQANKRQAYGADPEAGKKHSTAVSRRRKKYRGSYGKGISRVPRKILSRNGSQIYWVGAFAPGTVGGRQAHPPKAEKIWDVRLNEKERKKAIRSALSATINTELVTKRGHKAPTSYPFVVADDFEKLDKTKSVKEFLHAVGFDAELARTAQRKIRSGKGKMRGRKYKSALGPLLVVGDACQAQKAARNIPGIEVSIVNELNAEKLAPGCHPGRLTLFTQSAIKKLSEGKLYL